MPVSQLVAAFAAGAASAAAVFWGVAFRRIGCRRLGQPAVHVTKPHPDWVPGQKQPPPFDPDTMHVIDPATMPESEVYPLVISAVVPRPIGFAATMAADGAVNLAPFSYFNVLSHNPVILAFGVSRSALRSGGKKDSLQNIEETRQALTQQWINTAAFPLLISNCRALPPVVLGMAKLGPNLPFMHVIVCLSMWSTCGLSCCLMGAQAELCCAWLDPS